MNTSSYNLRLATQKGDPEAQYRLGVFLEKPENSSHIAEAERYYRRAADRGHGGAQKALAEMLKRKGQLDEAEKYFLMAQSNEYKAPELDAIIKNAADVSTEFERETDIAAKRGYRKRPWELDRALELKEIGENEEADKFFRIAAETGSPNILTLVGRHFKDEGAIDEAERYFRLAIDNGSESALHEDKYYGQYAQVLLADLLSEAGNMAETERFLRMAANGEDEVIANFIAKPKLFILLMSAVESTVQEMKMLTAERKELLTENDELISNSSALLEALLEAEPGILTEEAKEEVIKKHTLFEENIKKAREIAEKLHALNEKLDKLYAEVRPLSEEVKKVPFFAKKNTEVL